MDNHAFTIWMTGLPGAGKSTLARGVAERLRARGIDNVEVFDGDQVRAEQASKLGFNREDRDANIARIADRCKALTRGGGIAIAAAISPYRAAREKARADLGRFVEVYVRCPLEVLMVRDPKGLYRRALAGEIACFTGVSDPYEEPQQPDVTVESDRESVETSVRRVVDALEALGYLSPLLDADLAEDVYSSEEEELVTQRLKDLGYL